MMPITRLDHVQLAMPAGGEHQAREFYGGVLGFEEIPKPPTLSTHGGCWFRRGDAHVHLGVDAEFRAGQESASSIPLRRVPCFH